MTQWDLSDTPVIYFVCSNKKNTVSKKYEVIMKKCKRHAIGTLGELKTEQGREILGKVTSKNFLKFRSDMKP